LVNLFQSYDEARTCESQTDQKRLISREQERKVK